VGRRTKKFAIQWVQIVAMKLGGHGGINVKL